MEFGQLTSLNDNLLSKVLKKLELHAGISLYQTCKFMKEEIEIVRPRWRAEDLMIICGGGCRHHYWRNKKDKHGRCVSVVNSVNRPINYDFVVPKTVHVSGPNLSQMLTFGMVGQPPPVFIDYESDVLPDLRKWAAVPLLMIDRMGPIILEKVIAAAEPVAIEIREHHYDPLNPLFQNIENLNICTVPISRRWAAPQIIFDLGRTRKSVSLAMMRSPRQLLLGFVKKWLAGEDVGTMKEFAIWLQEDSEQLAEDRRAIIDEEIVQTDAVDIHELNENETVIGRRSDDTRLRLQCQPRSISFLFE